MFDASGSGMVSSPATYQIDSDWLIVRANYEFCRLFRARVAAPNKGWWDWRPMSPKMVWNFESHQSEPFAKAS